MIFNAIIRLFEKREVVNVVDISDVANFSKIVNVICCCGL